MSRSATSTCFLNTSRHGDSTTSQNSLFQCLTTLSVKKFFLISNLNLPWCNLRPLPLVLSLVTWVKRPAPASLQAPFSNKVSPQPPLLQTKQPRFLQPLLIRLVLQIPHQPHCSSLDTLQQLNVLLVVRKSKTEHRIGGAASPVPSTGAWSMPYSCWPHYSWYKPEQCWPSWPPRHTVRPCSASCQPTHPPPRSFSARQLSRHSSPSL